MFYEEDPEYEFEDDEMEDTPEEPRGGKQILGMSRNELIIFVVLLVVIVVLGWLFGSKVFGNRSSNDQAGIASAVTATVQPTKTPVPSLTPVPINTPVPGWSQFEFSGGEAVIWLPSSYQGGDTVEFEEIVLLTLNVYLDDPLLIESITPLVTSDDVIFFAFDTEPAAVLRFVYVMREDIQPGTYYPVDDFMDTLTDDLAPGSGRIAERGHVALDYYPDVAYLVFEEDLDLDEQNKIYIRIPTYGIPVDDTMWALMFRIGRDDYSAYRSTLDLIARSFYIQP